MSANINKKVIIFNGPPYCGKDTGALAVVSYVNKHAPWIKARMDKMSETMKNAVHAMFELVHSPEHSDKVGTKDTPYTQMLGKTPREVYISISEDWMKPVFGKDVFGRIMVNRMMRHPSIGLHVFSDGGFADEWTPIIEYVGAKNVLVVQVSATDKTFEGDSRGYVGEQLQAKHPKVQLVRIHNDISSDPTDRELYRLLCCGAAKRFLKLEHED